MSNGHAVNLHSADIIRTFLFQRQRDLAAERRQKGIEYVMSRHPAHTRLWPSSHLFHRHKPVYFEEDISSGKPTLSEEGRKAVQAELERAREV